jgi:DNA excision repair protein ERCC-2
MRTISQNPNENQTGISLWALEDIEKAQAKQKALTLLQEQVNDADMDEDDKYDDGGIDDQALMNLDVA